MEDALIMANFIERVHYLYPNNTQHKWTYHCTADMFDWFGFAQPSKTVVCLTLAKQLNTNRRSAVQ